MAFFEELKRRNVFRAGIAYAVSAWVLAQVAEFAFENFGAPDWVLKSFVIVLVLGFPIVLAFAWAFELTPDGIKREREIDRSRSIARETGRKLDRLVIGVLILAVAILVGDRLWLDMNAPRDPVIAPVQDQSIAVLPFVNMSNDEDHFADGLSEELLNLLAKIPELKVAGRTSSFVFKDRNEDLRTIGQALGVSTVLEGSVRRSGDRLRITAQLINVEDGFHLWSETYDREMTDIFDIQDDVARSITGALQLHLAPRERTPTRNAEAYALYMKALPYLATNENANLLSNVPSILDSAIALDPKFAKAHELKALMYWASTPWEIDGLTARELVFESAQNALAIDPTLVVAKLLAAISGPEGDSWKATLDAAESASRALPNDFNVIRVLCDGYLMSRYLDRARQCAERMVELEPLSSLSHFRLALTLSALDRRTDAVDSWLRSIELGGSLYWVYIATDEVIRGEYKAAISSLEKTDGGYGWQPQDAEEIIDGLATSANDDEFIARWVSEKNVGAVDLNDEVNLAYWYLVLGQVDAYWKVIDEIRGSTWTTWSNAYTLLRDGISFPQTGFARHPRYLEFAGDSDLIELWEARGAPDKCRKSSGGWTCE